MPGQGLRECHRPSWAVGLVRPVLRAAAAQRMNTTSANTTNFKQSQMAVITKRSSQPGPPLVAPGMRAAAKSKRAKATRKRGRLRRTLATSRLDGA